MYTVRRRLSATNGARSRQVRARSRIAMNTDLQQFSELMAKLSDPELVALRAAADLSPQVVPGLQTWLEHAFGWEIDRRAGFRYRLARPMEAIPREEVDASVVAIAMVAEALHGDDHQTAIAIVHAMEKIARLIEVDLMRVRALAPTGS